MDTANYLNFKDALSQAWCNKYAVVLALVIIKLHLFTQALISCLNLLQLSSTSLVDTLNRSNEALSHLPQAYQQASAQLMAHSLNSIKEKSLQWLLFLIVVIKAMASFFIEIFLGTFICLLDGAISGTVNFMVEVLDEIVGFFNDVIKSATSLLSSSVGELNKIINGIISGMNSVKSFFTGKDSVDQSSVIKKINVTLSDLDSVQIPDKFMEKINSLKSKVPSVNNLTDKTLDVLLSPLEVLGTSLNNSGTYSPVAAENFTTDLSKTTVAQIDHRALDSFYLQLQRTLESSYRSMLICLIAAIVLSTIFLIVKDYYKWKRSYNMYVEFQSINHKNEFDFLNTVNVYSNHVIYHTRKRWGLNNRQIWFLSYLTSPNSLTLLGISLAGLFMVFLQFLLLRIFINQLDKYPLDQLTSRIAANSSTNSEAFFKDANKVVLHQQDALNEELFGSVKNASSTVMESINEFVENLNKTVVDPFSSTPFEGPMSTVVYCVITRKLMTVENGLSWINKNLVINIPQFPEDMSEMTVPKTEDGFDGLKRMINRIKRMQVQSLWFEFYIAIGILGLWVVLVLTGLAMVAVRSYSRKDELKTGQRTFYDILHLSQDQLNEAENKRSTFNLFRK